MAERLATSAVTLPGEMSARPTPAPQVDLRPFTTSELIDRGFALYRANFAGLLLLALLCQSAPLLGQIIVTACQLSPTQSDLLQHPEWFAGKVGLITVVAFFGQIIVFGFEVVMTLYIADVYLGRVPSVKKSLQGFGRCVASSVWTCVLNRVLIATSFTFPAVALVSIYLYALFHPPLTWLPLFLLCAIGFILLIAAIAPVLVVFMRLMVTVPALALEGYSGWQAIQRSSDLVRYDPGLGIFYWGEMRLSFLLLPLFIIELLILSLTSLPVTLHQIGELMQHGSTGQISEPPDSIMIMSQVLTFLAGSLILPLYSIATTLFYYDIRIRREGFDLEWLATHLEPTT